jgi:hypothetical protein
MKNHFLLFFAIGLLVSCASKEDPDYPIQYYLTGIQPSWAPDTSFKEIQDSAYFYNLYADGTFKKQIGDQIAKGTFRKFTDEGQELIEMTFSESDRSIIHSCFNDRELFNIDDQKQLVGTWSHCDGPFLYFKGSTTFRFGSAF